MDKRKIKKEILDSLKKDSIVKASKAINNYNQIIKNDGEKFLGQWKDMLTGAQSNEKSIWLKPMR